MDYYNIIRRKFVQVYKERLDVNELSGYQLFQIYAEPGMQVIAPREKVIREFWVKDMYRRYVQVRNQARYNQKKRWLENRNLI